MMIDIVVPLIVSADKAGWMCTFFARNYDLKVSSIVERFTVVKPTLFLGVPRVWEKIAAKMVAAKEKAIAAGEMSAVAQTVREGVCVC
jgi:long-subunit acyl-CoA synthetase (AMP-forming)